MGGLVVSRGIGVVRLYRQLEQQLRHLLRRAEPARDPVHLRRVEDLRLAAEPAIERVLVREHEPCALPHRLELVPVVELPEDR